MGQALGSLIVTPDAPSHPALAEVGGRQRLAGGGLSTRVVCTCCNVHHG
jgi:hypothetical protein